MKKMVVGLFTVFAMIVGVAMAPIVPAASAVTNTIDDGIQGGINAANPDVSVNEDGSVTTNTTPSLFGSGSIFTTIVNTLLFIIGALSAIMLIYGGIRYTTSAGDSSGVTAAKNTIMYSIIGLVVAFLAFAVVNWVLVSLGKSTTSSDESAVVVTQYETLT